MKAKVQLFSIVILLLAIVALVFYSFNSDIENKTLFTITRNFDDDILKYDLRYDDEGELIDEDPIHPYWIRNTKGGIIKELNGMQRKFAYGLKYKKINDDFYKFNFVSYKKMDLYLKKASNGKYSVLTQIDDEFVILNELFLQVEKNGTIFDLPKLSWVDIKWFSPKTKKSGETRIDPND